MPFPAMMLQTLVENAIKQGLEPRTAAARCGSSRKEAKAACGHRSPTTAGLGATTPRHRHRPENVRERLRLAYGAEASLSVVANFPSGVAATSRCRCRPKRGGRNEP
jgi:LytS/YehU family sensor histidine kinase